MMNQLEITRVKGIKNDFENCKKKTKTNQKSRNQIALAYPTD